MAKLPKDLKETLLALPKAKEERNRYTKQWYDLESQALALIEKYEVPDSLELEEDKLAFNVVRKSGVLINEKALRSLLKAKGIARNTIYSVIPAQKVFDPEKVAQLVMQGDLTEEEVASVSEIKPSKPYISYGPIKEENLATRIKKTKNKA